MSADGTQPVGKITKQWSGLAKEYFTDADNFGIQCECFIGTCSCLLNIIPLALYLYMLLNNHITIVGGAVEHIDLCFKGNLL